MTKEEAIKRVKGYLTDYLPIEDGGELEEIIKALEQKPCEDAISRESMLNYQQYLHGKMSNEENHKLWEFIKGLPSITPAPKKGRWIPCTERMPKENECVDDISRHYLVQNEYGDMLVARYVKRDYWEETYKLGPIADKIVAWMPLPEKYKAKTEEKEV